MQLCQGFFGSYVLLIIKVFYIIIIIIQEGIFHSFARKKRIKNIFWNFVNEQ